MYSRQEASYLKQQFWTSFGQYMAPIPSVDGLKINWVNYKTGIKDLYFKMDADAAMATIAIVIGHASTERQLLFFNQFRQLKNLLRDALKEDWQWELYGQDENNKGVSRVYASLSPVNLYKKDDWPAIISFFKPRIIALDAFWAEVKEGFVL